MSATSEAFDELDELRAAIKSVVDALRLADDEKYDELKWQAFAAHIDRQKLERLAGSAPAAQEN